ncbi:Piwi-domain-containing protein [Hypoxylon sp. EC38]|nr:Piwi-domain-containing protein [Hypoxylon sp. EC38]
MAFRGRGRGQGHGQGLNEHEVRPDQTSHQERTNHEGAENSTMRKLAQTDSADGMPLRPKYGAQGTEAVLLANYVKLEAHKGKLFRYRISFLKPEETPKEKSKEKPKGKKLARVISLLIEDIIKSNQALYTNNLVTDFSEILISCVDISGQSLNKTYLIPYSDEDEEGVREDATTYEIKLLNKEVLSIFPLDNYLQNAHSGRYAKGDVIQALNIFLNYYSKSSKNHTMIGSSRSFGLNDKENQKDLSLALILIKGYYSSIRLTTGRILANINVSHGVFYREQNLQTLIHNYTNGLKNRGESILQKLARTLKGVRIKPSHTIKNKDGHSVGSRIRTFFDFATKSDGEKGNNRPSVQRYGAGPEEVSFYLKDHYITVAEFFKQEREREVVKNLPVVNVGTRQKPIYLPSELCKILSGQKAKVDLDERQKNTVTKTSIRDPVDNMGDIVRHGIKTIGLSKTDNRMLENFGLSLPDSRLISVPSRILPAPTVMYGQNTVDKKTRWNLDGIRFANKNPNEKWSCEILRIRAPSDDKDYSEFESSIKIIFQNMSANNININYEEGPRVITHNNNPIHLEQELKKVLETKTNVNDCLLVILPKKEQWTYNCVKRLADRAYGVITVCIIEGTILTKKADDVSGNLALKFNLKFKNDNQIIEKQALGNILDTRNTMIVGIDVTHSPEPDAPSIAGMVASVDKNLGQWPAVLRRQNESRQEMVTHLGEMLKTRLELWKTKNGSYPENILIYRDGVSEGQYKLVREQELPQLDKVCEEVYGKKVPKMTIVIVGKRHHTRFWAPQNNKYKQKQNPSPGTVVDRGVTDVLDWDFFMQAHSPVIGTARPAHYFVVHDQIFRAKFAKGATDKLETFTHSLCFMFGRTTGAVSICTPAYYADIACNRARCYVADANSNLKASETQAKRAGTRGNELDGSANLLIHPNLKDSMFYI